MKTQEHGLLMCYGKRHYWFQQSRLCGGIGMNHNYFIFLYHLGPHVPSLLSLDTRVLSRVGSRLQFCISLNLDLFSFYIMGFVRSTLNFFYVRPHRAVKCFKFSLSFGSCQCFVSSIFVSCFFFFQNIWLLILWHQFYTYCYILFFLLFLSSFSIYYSVDESLGSLSLQHRVTSAFLFNIILCIISENIHFLLQLLLDYDQQLVKVLILKRKKTSQPKNYRLMT